MHEKLPAIGLLIIRLILGVSLMIHGLPKLAGGADKWTALGSVMGMFGITFAPVFWGFMAAISEFFGGLFLALGLFRKTSCLLIFSTMLVAALMHTMKGDPSGKILHPLEIGFTVVGLFFTGYGSISLDYILRRVRGEK